MKVTSQDILNLAKAFDVPEIRKYTHIKDGLLEAILDTIRAYKENNNAKV